MTPDPAALVRDFDLARLPPAFYDDPYPTYHALRRHAPVKRLADGTVFITRHDLLTRIYRDARIFSSDKKREFAPKFGATPLLEHHPTSLVFNDPPLQTRVRRLIADPLTPRVMAAMEPGLVMLVERLLDAMAGRGEVDLIADFAAAIPVEVIGNLLDIPQDERGPLRDWSLDILGALEPVLTPQAAARGNRSVAAFLAYLDTLVARRRARPGNAEHDILTRLILGEPDGARLTAKELLHNCIFLLNAGHETTTNLIGNGLVTLLAHPAERQRLIAEPALIRSAVEEMLRYESPVQLGNRISTEATELDGVALPAGTPIHLGIGAANRDPAQFADPDRFDVGRTPNRHLAFAAGIHQCAGLSLARLEAGVAISLFLARYPRYALAGPPARGGRARFRGFLQIPCTLHG